MKLVRKRKYGALRRLPYLAPGSDQRTAAKTVAARRTKGETINAIAEDVKASNATVRLPAQQTPLQSAGPFEPCNSPQIG